ncbi:hypothetical protein HU200_047607 [Digitaria exilis]|uniref:Uncharacterized protein n=1 Tax=Digitaria exilis TaxID=1010633 RepID=A0A835EE46_9POAL|nr:hypothetical protein HU200_047607 [Digitaria exilis]
MARRLNVAVVTSALLLAAAVVSLCSPSAGAARQLGAGREAAAVAVAPLVTGPLQAQVEMAGALQVPAGGGEAGEDGSVATASKRLSPGGPDPQHH